MLAQFAPWVPVLFVRHWALIGTGALACISGFDYALKMAWRLSAAPEQALGRAPDLGDS